MEELYFVYATVGLIVLYLPRSRWSRGSFDPFAPVWLFLVGYVQVYVIQAMSYHEWALDVAGQGSGRRGQFPCLLGPPLVPLRSTSSASDGTGARFCRVRRGLVAALGRHAEPAADPVGLCSARACSSGEMLPRPRALPARKLLFRSFPFVMMVAAVMLIVTGRTIQRRRRRSSCGGAIGRGRLRR